MTAGVDDEAMKAERRQLLAEDKQRRQIKIHRHTMDKDQCEIGRALRRRKKRAMQALVIGSLECADLGSKIHR